MSYGFQTRGWGPSWRHGVPANARAADNLSLGAYDPPILPAGAPEVLTGTEGGGIKNLAILGGMVGLLMLVASRRKAR